MSALVTEEWGLAVELLNDGHCDRLIDVLNAYRPRPEGPYTREVVREMYRLRRGIFIEQELQERFPFLRHEPASERI